MTDINALLDEGRRLVDALDNREWVALVFDNANEANAHGHWPVELRWLSVGKQFHAPDGHWTSRHVGALYAKSGNGITGIPGAVYSGADEIRFMAFARKFVPIILKYLEDHQPEIEAVGRTAYGLDLSTPSGRLSLFSLDQGQSGSLLQHAYLKAEERRLREKARNLKGGQLDERASDEDARWRERNEAILRDANAKVCLSREAFDAVHQADLFQPPVPK